MPAKATRSRLLKNAFSIALLAGATLLGILLAACSTAASPTATTGQLATLNSVDEIQAAFNQQSVKTRILLLAAPT
jgi:hypothetical protein